MRQTFRSSFSSSSLSISSSKAWSCCVTAPASAASAAGAGSPTAASCAFMVSTSFCIVLQSGPKKTPRKSGAQSLELVSILLTAVLNRGRSPVKRLSAPPQAVFFSGLLLLLQRRWRRAPPSGFGRTGGGRATRWMCDSVRSSPAASALFGLATSASAPSGGTAAPPRLSGSLSLPPADLEVSFTMVPSFLAGRWEPNLSGLSGIVSGKRSE